MDVVVVAGGVVLVGEGVVQRGRNCLEVLHTTLSGVLHTILHHSLEEKLVMVCIQKN